jgi:small ligand-binding sensory domain FIST
MYLMNAPPNTSTNLNTPLAASAISGHFDTRTAATEIADMLFDELSVPVAGLTGRFCDLLLLFASFHHRAAFADAASIIHKTLSPGAMLGTTAEAVIGSDRELEGTAGMSAIAMRLPGVTVHSWSSTPDDPIPLREPQKIRERIGFNADSRVAIMMADPFTTPITRLLPALTGCGEVTNDELRVTNETSQTNETTNSSLDTRHSSLPVIIIGGMSSGASQPGFNVLALNDRVIGGGAVGVSLSGNLDIDFIVSQGCRPIGKPMVITRCRENVIFELGGRNVIELLRELGESLSEADKRLLSRGLLMGSVVNEYKDHFGRGDFLVRNVMGIDQKANGLAVGEMCRVGQTVQFQVRDAATAAEDLQLLLDAQVMQDRQPFAALLFSCNGRGERLFGRANHDLDIIRERLGDIPIAGFFAAGEFGPIGGRSYLHGHTASLAVLRARS